MPRSTYICEVKYVKDAEKKHTLADQRELLPLSEKKIIILRRYKILYVLCWCTVDRYIVLLCVHIYNNGSGKISVSV